MGRLRTLSSPIGTLGSSIRSMPEGRRARDRERASFHPWRKLYKTARWIALRWATLVRDDFTCQMCGKVEPDSSKLVADHKRPHRGDEALFFDPENLWTLCASPCHAKHKQRLEQAAEYR